MLNQLIEQGYIEADEVKSYINGTLKSKVSQISESLFGNITNHQIFLIREAWDHIAYLEKTLEK